MKQKVNRKTKDRLFRLVFSRKEALLALYNAVNKTKYEDQEELQIITLDDVIYMNIKGDVSLLLDSVLALYEHQSTFNPNMPVRGLFYFAELYRKYVEEEKINVYSSSLKTLPFPQFVVFYNGARELPELKLSDAFPERLGLEPSLEVKAMMININFGKNKELMERCRPLLEYSRFVAELRNAIQEGNTPEEAAELAIEHCIREGILTDLLREHRAEVRNVILEEYNEQEHMEMERKESFEKGRRDLIKRALASGKSAKEVADFLMISLDEVKTAEAESKKE